MEGRERRVRALANQIGNLDAKDREALQRAAEILKSVVRAI